MPSIRQQVIGVFVFLKNVTKQAVVNCFDTTIISVRILKRNSSKKFLVEQKRFSNLNGAHLNFKGEIVKSLSTSS